MSEINKVISKIYVWNNEFKCNTVVAEVIENPGMGFEWLIRIDPDYKYNMDIFTKCLKICGKSFDEIVNTFTIDDFYKKGYPFSYEEIALISDKVI